MEDFWFMQNGATLHRTKPVSSLSNRTFNGTLLGLGYPSEYGCGFNSPPFSPDITETFFSKKIYWKKFFSKKHFEVNFFYKQYITKKLHNIFSKKLKKKILEIVISIFKKLRKKTYKKKSVKYRLIRRF